MPGEGLLATVFETMEQEHERAARTEAEAEALRQVEQTRRDLGRLARLRAAWRDGGPSGSRGTAR